MKRHCPVCSRAHPYSYTLDRCSGCGWSREAGVEAFRLVWERDASLAKNLVKLSRGRRA